MKKLLGILVLGLLLSGNAYSEDFVYNCKFKTSYKNDTGKKLKSTNDKYTNEPLSTKKQNTSIIEMHKTKQSKNKTKSRQ